MNIMDYLIAKSLGLTENQADEMELAIRAGIAQELEDLVSPLVPHKLHGIPASVELQTTLPGLQQDMFRGAANCIRGKDPATEADWEGQAAGMNHRRRVAMAQKLAQIGKMPPAEHIRAEENPE